MFDLIRLCLPEIVMLLIIAGLFGQSLLARERDPDSYYNRAPIWLAPAAFIAFLVGVFSLDAQGLILHKVYQLDLLSQMFKAAMMAGFFLASMAGRNLRTPLGVSRTDYCLFLAISAFGLMVMCSSVELITMYVAMELSSYSIYVLVPLRSKDRRAAEAGIKYILFGAAITAMALYGFSYILASAESGYLADLARLAPDFFSHGLAAVGLGLFMAGLLFKLALFPLHFWAPDVYQGTGHETATFISALPKLGAAVVLVRLAMLVEPGGDLALLLAVLAAISMTAGNIMALAQKDVRRMLGYSAVAHAGYLVMGLASGGLSGLAAVLFYALSYGLMIMAAFFILGHLFPDGRNIALNKLRGLHRRAPLMTLALAISIISLIGLPPTAGFIGKFFLFTSAWSQGYHWLVIVGAANTVISLGYYLAIIRLAYTADPEEANKQTHIGQASIPPGALFWSALMAGLLLLLGVMPRPVMEMAETAVNQLVQ